MGGRRRRCSRIRPAPELEGRRSPPSSPAVEGGVGRGGAGIRAAGRRGAGSRGAVALAEGERERGERTGGGGTVGLWEGAGR